MSALLDRHGDVVVSGTVENQGRFYDRFEHVVLLSAPVEVLIERVASRTNNPYGRSADQQARFVSTWWTSNLCFGEGQRSSLTVDARLESWPTRSKR